MTEQLPQVDIALRATQWMGLTDSFIPGSSPGHDFPLLTSSTSMGTVFGIYLNNKSSYIVVTSRGLSVLFNEHSYFVAYADIAQITEPNKDDRDIDVLVESIDASGSKELMLRSYLIPVLGETNGIPDILEFYGFLSQVVKESRIVVLELKDVSSQSDVASYVRGKCKWEWEYVDALVENLEKNLNPDALRDLAIDETLLHRPDFWRAVAFICCPPIKI